MFMCQHGTIYAGPCAVVDHGPVNTFILLNLAHSLLFFFPFLVVSYFFLCRFLLSNGIDRLLFSLFFSLSLYLSIFLAACFFLSFSFPSLKTLFLYLLLFCSLFFRSVSCRSYFLFPLFPVCFVLVSVLCSFDSVDLVHDIYCLTLHYRILHTTRHHPICPPDPSHPPKF